MTFEMLQLNGLTSATFSSGDVLSRSRSAKILMMIQAVISLLVIALLAGTRSQHPLKHFLLEILDNKARRFYSMSNPPGLFVQPRCCD